VSQLDRIALRAADRLCALIFGLADYSADLGLPAITTDHPAADWARARIVTVAAGVGVPAIDGMTLAYPVSDPRLDAAADRERFLARMTLVHGEAVRAREMGMLGKWVGRGPALRGAAHTISRAPETLEMEAAKLAAYAASVLTLAKARHDRSHVGPGHRYVTPYGVRRAVAWSVRCRRAWDLKVIMS
jgi:hypothetical protein